MLCWRYAIQRSSNCCLHRCLQGSFKAVCVHARQQHYTKMAPGDWSHLIELLRQPKLLEQQQQQHTDLPATLEHCLAQCDAKAAVQCMADLRHCDQPIGEQTLSRLLRLLLEQNCLAEAQQCYAWLRTKGIDPQPSVFQLYSKKLAAASDNNTDATRRHGLAQHNSAYFSSLFLSHKIDAYLSNLINDVMLSLDDGELDTLDANIPRGAVMKALQCRPDLADKILPLARLLAKKKRTDLMEVVWQYQVSVRNVRASHGMFARYLRQTYVNFPIYLQQIASRKLDDGIVQLAIDQLATGAHVPAHVTGAMWSLLIELQVQKGALDTAVKSLESAWDNVSLRNMDANLLHELKAQVEATGKNFNYPIPPKQEDHNACCL